MEEEKKNIPLTGNEIEFYRKKIEFINGLDLSYLDKCLLYYQTSFSRNLSMGKVHFNELIKGSGISKNYSNDPTLIELEKYLNGVSKEEISESATKLLPLLEKFSYIFWENPLKEEHVRLSGRVAAPIDFKRNEK